MCMCVIHFLLLTLDRGGRRGGSKKSPGENSSFEKGNVPREARPFPKTRVVVHDENEPKKIRYVYMYMCQYICTVHVTEANETWFIIRLTFSLS